LHLRKEREVYSVSEVQTLLGHKSPETTFIYLHASSSSMVRVKSPLDRLQDAKYPSNNNIKT